MARGRAAKERAARELLRAAGSLADAAEALARAAEAQAEEAALDALGPGQDGPSLVHDTDRPGEGDPPA